MASPQGPNDPCAHFFSTTVKRTSGDKRSNERLAPVDGDHSATIDLGKARFRTNLATTPGLGVDQPLVMLSWSHGGDGSDDRLMRLIGEQFLETPWYGSRQVARHICCSWCVGRHRVRRLMTKIGLTPIFQHPKTSEPTSAAQDPSVSFRYGITGASAGS